MPNLLLVADNHSCNVDCHKSAEGDMGNENKYPAESTTMNIIFLDFDGVMDTAYYDAYLVRNDLPESDANGRPLFDPQCIDNLKKIIEHTGADIVVTSDWKYIDSFSNLLDMWEQRKMPGLLLDTTPNISSHRGNEIDCWLKECKSACNYVIIDDLGAENFNYHQLENLVIVNPYTGLDDNVADRAISILNRQINNETTKLFLNKNFMILNHIKDLLQKVMYGETEVKDVPQPLLQSKLILGAITGDVIGSFYEFYNIKSTTFPLFRGASRFTDDTVMTIAVADWILSDDKITCVLKEWGNRYIAAGYGGMFYNWLQSENPQPYNSFGNGSAMRVSYVGWAFDTLEKTLDMAKQSAEVSHNHPEGIKGAQAIAACIFLARTGKTKQEIKEYIETTFGYDLNRSCNEIRPGYKFDVTCQGSVPEAIVAFLDSHDFEDAIRLAISLGGDSDTIGAMTGAIAEAHYGGVPADIAQEVLKRLPNDFIEIMLQFSQKFVK